MIAYAAWKAAGAPATPAICIADFVATMRRHGYTVYIFGNAAHQRATPPEDHMPFSSTPWPGSQPYPQVLACDVMPGGALDWRVLGERIVADKNAGRIGTEWIKYINYTDRAGKCWHASWQPTYRRTPSGDTGHIHISARTDFASKHTTYDPVTNAPATATPEQEGDDMTASLSGQLAPGFGMTEKGVRLDMDGHEIANDAVTVPAVPQTAISLEPTPGDPPPTGGAFSGWTRPCVISFTADQIGSVPVLLRVAHGDGGAGYVINTVTLTKTSPRGYLQLPAGTAKISVTRVRASAADTRGDIAVGYSIVVAK